jgi:hypothetical protein
METEEVHEGDGTLTCDFEDAMPTRRGGRQPTFAVNPDDPSDQ